jgi:hypothetical protein
MEHLASALLSQAHIVVGSRHSPHSWFLTPQLRGDAGRSMRSRLQHSETSGARLPVRPSNLLGAPPQSPLHGPGLAAVGYNLDGHGDGVPATTSSWYGQPLVKIGW